jgi:CheY-like chemotaxis protein
VNLSKRRILVVDDAGPIVVLCVNILQSLGHTVRAAMSGATALELIKNEPFDLAVIDYRMPEMDGFEVLEKARALRPNMAFMLITAFATSDVVEDALNLGFNAVLSKPFTRNQFGAAVSKALAAVA